MTERHYHPFDWRLPVAAMADRIRIGDVVHNPVYRDDTGATRQLADDLDAALAARGLRLDHPQCSVAFVVAR